MPGRGKAQHDLSMGTIRQRFQRQLQQKHQKREREQQGFPGLRLFKSPLLPMRKATRSERKYLHRTVTSPITCTTHSHRH
jgi:hypothetical protein